MDELLVYARTWDQSYGEGTQCVCVSLCVCLERQRQRLREKGRERNRESIFLCDLDISVIRLGSLGSSSEMKLGKGKHH